MGKITCALSPTQIENLYKDVYKNMSSLKKGQTFDPNAYMSKLFSDIKNKKDKETAAKFVQPIPRLVTNIAMRYPDIEVSVDSVRKLIKQFEDTESGINTIINNLDDIDTSKSLLALKNLNDYIVQNYSSNEGKDVGPVELDYLPRSVFATTFQELEGDLEKREKRTDFEILSDEKKYIYNTLKKLRKDNKFNSLSPFITYDGKDLQLKTFTLKELYEDTTLAPNLPQKFRDQIGSSINFKDSKNLAQRVALVIVDSNENFVFFDPEGKVSNQKDGKLVFQLLRRVDKEKDKYTAYNFDATDISVLPSFLLAERDFTSSLEEIEKQQQLEFKQVYDLTQKVRKGDKFNIHITGVSEGVPMSPNRSRIPLTSVEEISMSQEDILLTAEHIDKSRNGFKKGSTVVTINDREILLEKPDSTREINAMVVDVLFDPNLSVKEKRIVYNQFFRPPSRIENSTTQRHIAQFSDTGGKIYFNYNTLTPQERRDSKKPGEVKSVIIDNKNIDPAGKETILTVLNNAKGSNGNYYPLKMHYKVDLIKGDTFYLYQDGKLVEANYLDFITGLPLELNTTKGQFYFNSYIEFSPNLELQSDLSSLETREVDEFMEVLEKEKNNPKPIEEVLANKIIEDVDNPSIRQDLLNKLNRESADDYLLRVKLLESEIINNASQYNIEIAEKTMDLLAQASGKTIIPEDVAEIFFKKIVPYLDPQKNNTENQAKAEDQDNLDDDFELFRTQSKDLNVSAEEIKAAEEWFKNSPLSKFIEFDPLQRMVNSDVFAKFVVSGSKLYIEATNDGKLAEIKIGKGSSVDVYHEAWHVFSQLFLTKPQKVDLYNEVRNSNAKYKDLSFLEIEEILAEDFRDYGRNQKSKKGSPKRNSIFRKMWNFLKALFGKGVTKSDSFSATQIPMVNEMFNKLYFGTFNNLTPSIDNIMYNELNRGVRGVSKVKDYVLSPTEADAMLNATDSIISEYLDSLVEKTKNKAYVISALRSSNNKAKLYEQVRKTLDAKAKEFRNKLGDISDKSFNQATTVDQLEKISAGYIVKKNEEKLYAFTTSQISDFTKLTPALKKGLRVKGQVYFDINIVADFYYHNDLVNKDGTPVQIMVVADQTDIIDQYDNYLQAGAKNFKDVVINEKPKLKPLTAEQNNLLNKIKVLETTLANFGDPSNGFVNYHLKNSAYEYLRAEDKDSLEGTDYVDENGEEVDITDPESGSDSAEVWDKKVGKTSILDDANPQTKYIFKSLFAVNREGKNELDEYGFKKRADFYNVWNLVTRQIAGIKDPQAIYDKLVESQDLIPELKQLIQYKLPNPADNAKTSSEFDTTTAIWQDFSKSELPYLQTTYFAETGEVKIIEASMEAPVIIQRWVNIFKNDLENPFVQRTSDNVNLLNVNQLVNKYKNDSGSIDKDGNKIFGFLRGLGLYLDDTIAIKEDLEKNFKEYGIAYIFDIAKKAAIIERGERVYNVKQNNFLEAFKKNPLGTINSKIEKGVLEKDKEVNQSNNIKKLAELHANKGFEALSFGVPNAAGDTVFPHIADNEITRIGYELNNAKTLSDMYLNVRHMEFLNPSKNSFTENSQIIKSLFDFTSDSRKRLNKRSFQLFMNSGTQIVNSDGTKEGVNTTDLDQYGYFLQNIHSLLGAGVVENPRHASKKSSYGSRVKGGLKRYDISVVGDDHLYVPTNTFSGSKGPKYAFDNILLGYIETEFQRIKMFKSDPKYKNYLGFNRKVKFDGKEYLAGELFTAFDNILTDTTKKKLYSLIEKGTDSLTDYVTNQDTKLYNDLFNEVTEYFKEETTRNRDFLRNNEYIAPALLEKTNLEGEDAINAVMKSYTYNSWIHNFEMIHLFYGSLAQFNHAKEEFHKRNTGASSGGPKFRTDIAARKFINEVFNAKAEEGAPVNTYSESIGEKIFKYSGVFNTAVLRDVEIDSIYLKEIKESLEELYTQQFKDAGVKDYKDKVAKKVAKDIKAYSNMEEGDGAGYITFDVYRTLKKLENDWSDDQETFYKKIVRKEKYNTEDVKHFFPPYKLQNFGPLANEGMTALAMHKFSLFPLIPDAIEGSDLQNLHDQMIRKDIQYVTFGTGSKGTTITSDGSRDQIYNDDADNGKTYKSFNEDIKFTKNRIYVEYLKKASPVNRKYKNQTSYPTQVRGLILDGAFTEGMPKTKNYEEKVAQYKKAIDNSSDVLRLELLEEIGYKYDPISNSYFGKPNQFLDLIKRELEDRDLPNHLLDVIGVTPKGNLISDLSIHIKADIIEKTLVSIIEKRLIKQKVKGEPLLQMPVSMFGTKWSVDTKDGTNGLPFYQKSKGRTKAMKVALALQGDFVNLLNLEYKGKAIGNIETLNQAIKDETWVEENRESITIAGPRIPVQEHNSMEVAEIYHFLPASFGNQVVVPSELVAKAGSDFDGDKLFFTYPHLDKSGKVVKSALSLKELEERYDKAKDKKEKKEIRNQIQIKKKALENETLKATADLLLLPENYALLVKPNDTYLLQDIVEDVKDYQKGYNRFENRQKVPTSKNISPTRVLEALYNVNNLKVNMTGKDGLGIVALENKQHPIKKSIGAAMPKEVEDIVYVKGVKAKGNVKRELNIRLSHNRNKDGRISLSSELNKSGTKIGDLHSHLMNGLVDVEKDPWVFYVRANLESLNILNYLIEAGVDERAAVYFLSQPLIQEYVEEKQKIKSPWRKIITGKESEKEWMAAGNILKGYLSEDAYNRLESEANLQRFKDAISQLPEIIVNGKKIKTSTIKNIDTFIGYVQGFSFIDPSNRFRYSYQKDKLTGPTMLPYAEMVANSMTEDLYTKDALLKNLAENKKEKNLAYFLHLLLLENDTRGYSEAKKLFNPDTKLSKTSFQSSKRKANLKNIKKEIGVPADLVDDYQNKSILSSFYKNDISTELIKPLFTLRLNDTFIDYLTYITYVQRVNIKNKFGVGVEGQERFTSALSNAVVNYIYQNTMSHITDGNGNIITRPTEYGGYEVKENKKLDVPAKVIDNVLYVNYNMLNEDYNEALYLKQSSSDKSYKSRGLMSFNSREYFKNPVVFVKYHLEKAKQEANNSLEKAKKDKDFLNFKSMLKLTDDVDVKAYEAYITEKALIYSFNPYVMLKGGKLSYSEKILEVIKDNPELKEQFPVLQKLQIAEAPSRRKYKILTLSNKRELNREISDSYEQNIRQLADPTVKKVSSAVENQRISEWFSLFNRAMVYQHGVGYSANSINDIVNQTEINEIIRNESNFFIEEKLEKQDGKVLNSVFNTLMSPDYIKNYIEANPKEYNDPEAAVPVTPEVIEEAASLLPVGIEIISPDYGVVKVETNPTEQETQYFVDLIKPQIKAQTYKENKGTFANEMFHYGLMWARNNSKAKPVKIQKFEGINNNYYNYHALDQNGNSLPSINILQPIIDKIEKSLGIDMSNYDSVIGNIYLDNQYVYPHKDTTESVTARNYPVIVYTLGNESGLGIVDNSEGKMTFANSYDIRYLPSGDKLTGYTNEVLTKNGSIYTFGLDGKGRFELTHSTPTNSKKTGVYPPITLPNGKVLTNYTITLTFRRAQDLEPGMPTAPAKIETESTQPQGSVNLGTKTAPAGGNVVIDATKGRSPQPGAVVAFRTKGKTEQNMIDALVDNAVGNPFGPYAAIKVGDTGEAVTRFLNWLEGTGDTNVMQDYRNALLSKVSELKGKTIYYYKDLGRPSHATALDYFLNKPTTQPQAVVKPGVVELFNSTPELAAIGTPEQYSQYLDTIFPDSKVKDIVYHGFKLKKDDYGRDDLPIQTFNKKLAPKGFYFTTDKDYAQSFTEKFTNVKQTGIIQVIVNLKNPKQQKDLFRTSPEIATKEGKDGFVGNDMGFEKENVVVVFEPDQIHILGNKQDIEGFKGFVSTQPAVSEGQLDLFEQEIEDSQNNVESKIADSDSLGRNYDVSLDPEEGPNWTEEDNESEDPFMC